MALPNLEALLEEKKLPGLDGFRMVAVMAVVLAHSGVGTLFFSARHGVAGVIPSGALASASYHFLEKRFLRLKQLYEVVGAKPGRSPMTGNPSGMESLAARERSS
ncbi:hypothetical protein [Marinobacter nauticus]|uniref:Acyltransferase n=1 Tax=Marinobacter nauticus TaxID=2743 RepID=A0A368UW10_MARNT|nr:hypothetical protein [Marinobacter nauticus]RBP71971.1 hypothetical protein DET64_108217 [Marinobacter nauticus]RCW32989.1 hypothetical protein DET51_108216 [Marinobacter nauticus]